jgi:hypothetical protein
MPTPKEVLGIKGDECICGRRMSILHCAACGSTRVYARMNRMHRHMNGEIKHVDKQFRCQRCGHEFIDAEREFCEAPATTRELAKEKVKAIYEAGQAGQPMNPAEEKAFQAIRELVPEPPKTQKEAYQAFRRLEVQIQGVYADEAMRANRENRKLNETVQQFVDRHLNEMKVQRVYPPAEDDQSNQQGE